MFILQIAAGVMIAYVFLFIVGMVIGMFRGVEKAPITGQVYSPERDLRDWQRENGYL